MIAMNCGEPDTPKVTYAKPLLATKGARGIPKRMSPPSGEVESPLLNASAKGCCTA